MKRKIVPYACLAMWLAASCSLVQGQDILAFHGNGTLTWTNSNPNLFYRVEWAPSLTVQDAWRSSYSNLMDIRSSAFVVTSAVPMFYRICGSSNRVVNPAPVPKTGAGDLPDYTEIAGEDGHASMRKGTAWPNPRFTDKGNGTVTDNLTGLIWLKNANAYGMRDWATALTNCATLHSGEAGLTDGSVEGDWRLPNVQEMQSLIDYKHAIPALCNTAGTGQWTPDDPFTGVVKLSYYYWTSTTRADGTMSAWYVALSIGSVGSNLKSGLNYVWPVRGGK